jgi:hypothetical protein
MKLQTLNKNLVLSLSCDFKEKKLTNDFNILKPVDYVRMFPCVFWCPVSIDQIDFDLIKFSPVH